MKKNDEMEYYPERRKKMPPENTVTKVRFDLWAVLILIALCIGYLYVGLASTKEIVQKDKQEISERVVKLEIKFGYIVTGIENLEKSQKDIVDMLRKQSKSRSE